MMVGPERFERPTPSFVAKCSIQLSYGPFVESQFYSTTKSTEMNCVGDGKIWLRT